MQNFDLTAAGETLLQRTVHTMLFSCNSEELYKIGGDINYEVGSKTLLALLDCRKPRSYVLRVKQQLVVPPLRYSTSKSHEESHLFQAFVC